MKTKLTFVSLLIVFFIIFNVTYVLAESNLPLVNVVLNECHPTDDGIYYGTLFTFKSLTNVEQILTVYELEPKFQKLAQYLIAGGETINMFDLAIENPATRYQVNSYYTDGVQNGSNEYAVRNCTRRLWIPKVEGVNVLE